MAPFIPCGRSCFYAPLAKSDWGTGRDRCRSLGGDSAMLKTGEKQEEAKEYLDAIWDQAQCNGKINTTNDCYK